jgi:hypothetical protein
MLFYLLSESTGELAQPAENFKLTISREASTSPRFYLLYETTEGGGGDYYNQLKTLKWQFHEKHLLLHAFICSLKAQGVGISTTSWKLFKNISWTIKSMFCVYADVFKIVSRVSQTSCFFLKKWPFCISWTLPHNFYSLLIDTH